MYILSNLLGDKNFLPKFIGCRDERQKEYRNKAGMKIQHYPHCAKTLLYTGIHGVYWNVIHMLYMLYSTILYNMCITCV